MGAICDDHSRITRITSKITDHRWPFQNNNNENVWNIMRINKMWHRDVKMWRDDGCVYGIDCGDGFMGVDLPPNLSSCIHYVQPFVRQPYFNKVVFKKS